MLPYIKKSVKISHFYNIISQSWTLFFKYTIYQAVDKKLLNKYIYGFARVLPTLGAAPISKVAIFWEICKV